MSWHYLQALAADSLAHTCSDGGQSAPWKLSRSAEKCSSDVNGTACFPCSRSGMMFAHSTVDRGMESWMSLLRASRVSRLAQADKCLGQMTSETNGQPLSGSFAKFDHDSRSWRTYRVCLISNTSEPYSATWPKAGMTLGGRVYRRRAWERLIRESGFGLWPTPLKRDKRTVAGDQPIPGRQGGQTLAQAVVAWMSPTAVDAMRGEYTYDRGDHSRPRWSLLGQAKSLLGKTGQPVRLHPEFHCWLQGWPMGWNDLHPLATDKFQQWLEQHGNSCLEG